jgi:hypothetical protein
VEVKVKLSGVNKTNRLLAPRGANNMSKFDFGDLPPQNYFQDVNQRSSHMMKLLRDYHFDFFSGHNCIT